MSEEVIRVNDAYYILAIPFAFLLVSLVALAKLVHRLVEAPARRAIRKWAAA